MCKGNKYACNERQEYLNKTGYNLWKNIWFVKFYKKYSKRNFRYEFTFGGKLYNGTSTGYITDGVKEEGIYKVEFSKENPEHNRMIFDTEYEQKLIFDQNGQITDTTYVHKGKKFQNKMKEIIEEYEFKSNNIKN